MRQQQRTGDDKAGIGDAGIGEAGIGEAGIGGRSRGRRASPRRAAVRTLWLLPLVVLLAAAGRIADNPVSLTVTNYGAGRLVVTIYDAVCNRVAFSGQILRHATITLNVCGDLDRGGSAALIVADQVTGQNRTYDDLRRGEEVRLR